MNSHIPDSAIPSATGNEAIHPQYNANITMPDANASTSDDDHPIAAPSSFKYLDDQLNKMDNVLDEQEDASADEAAKPINTITRATRKMMKQLVIPGVATVGAASVGYVLLFGRTMYSALAMFLGLGLGSQRLDPATLLEFWERESWKRDDHDKKVESMFGDRKAAVPARFRRR